MCKGSVSKWPEWTEVADDGHVFMCVSFYGGVSSSIYIASRVLTGI
jgi:hypothetical protein